MKKHALELVVGHFPKVTAAVRGKGTHWLCSYRRVFNKAVLIESARLVFRLLTCAKPRTQVCRN